MQSDRTGEARQVCSLVRQRRNEVLQIERDMYQLAGMFEDMCALVIQQDETIVDIEKQGEQVVENTVEANRQLETTIDLAKARNRKKWWCALIVGMCASPN